MQDKLEMWVLSLGQEVPLEEKWQHAPVFLPRESHGQSCLAKYSRKELDMTRVT